VIASIFNCRDREIDLARVFAIVFTLAIKLFGRGKMIVQPLFFARQKSS
jgi:hypothetical protein